MQCVHVGISLVWEPEGREPGPAFLTTGQSLIQSKYQDTC
jgi:hypothetical protein